MTLTELLPEVGSLIRDAYARAGEAAPPIPDEVTRQALFRALIPHRLPVRWFPQDTGWSCGAAAFRSVLDLFGRAPDKEVSARTLLGTDPQDGTRPAEVLGAARLRGLVAEGRQRMALADLERAIDARRPVMVPIQRHGGGHWCVVAGYGDEHFLILDPAKGEGEALLTPAELIAAWWDKDADGLWYVRYGITFRPRRVAVRAGRPRQKLAEDSPADTAPTVSASPDIAGPARDRERARELLRNALRDGAEVLAKVAGSAVRRLLATGAPAGPRLFDPAERLDLADALAAPRATAELLGRSRVRIRQEHAEAAQGARSFAENVTDFSRFDEAGLRPLAPEKALEYFRALVPRLGIDPGPWAAGHRREAFTLAEATEKAVLEKVQAAIAERIQSGDVPTGTQAVRQILAEAGVSPKNPQYAEMVFRTNLMDSYNRGQDAERQDPDVIATFPVWRYVGIRDGRQGADHEPHFDQYFPAAVAFAQVRDSLVVRDGRVVASGGGEGRPFNCRCTAQEVDKWEWARLRQAGARIAEGYPDVPAMAA